MREGLREGLHEGWHEGLHEDLHEDLREGCVSMRSRPREKMRVGGDPSSGVGPKSSTASKTYFCL
jgi:hypothetical protein